MSIIPNLPRLTASLASSVDRPDRPRAKLVSWNQNQAPPPLRPLLPTNWGGSYSNWQPEAVFANAASNKLNEKRDLPNLDDVVVSMSGAMEDTARNPYGDGQTNSVARIGNWGVKWPPVIATLMTFKNGTRSVEIQIDRQLGSYLRGNDFEVTTADGTSRTFTATKRGDNWIISYDLAGGMPLANDPSVTAFIRPTTGSDGNPFIGWFPFSFDINRATVADAMKRFPATLANGTPLPDPLNVKTTGNGTTAFDRLNAMANSGELDQQGFNVYRLGGEPGIHGDAPVGDHVHAPNGSAVTGVGGGTTIEPRTRPAPGFVHLYTCFHKRNLELENKYGVPSGSGWHRTGDDETILNTLEREPALVGHSKKNTLMPPKVADQNGNLQNAGYSFALDQMLTFRLLQPGEAFRSDPNGGRHVYYISQLAQQIPDEFCTEEPIYRR